LDPNKRYLQFQIICGKAFLEYLNPLDEMDYETIVPGTNQTNISYFTIYLHFRGQRFKTNAFPCSCEPNINEMFTLELSKDKPIVNDLGGVNNTNKMPDISTLLSISDQIHLVMIRTDSNQDNHLISSHFLEWRTLLSMPDTKRIISIELMGTGAESKIPAGILNISMQLTPSLVEPLREDILTAQLGMEHSKNTERERLFIVYSKQWWKEYLEIRDDHKFRLVKIFAQVK
jgi:centrosomal protein CEP76